MKECKQDVNLPPLWIPSALKNSYSKKEMSEYGQLCYQAALESEEVQGLRDALIESDAQLKQFLPLIEGGIIHVDEDFHWCLTKNRTALAQEQGEKHDN